jgi:2-polyprenyl-3-methyl-5-hydroxy-6-metoxy-1,4-benzoquinol methylase
MTNATDIVSSWNANAGNWIATIENSELESRRLATNAAIVNTVLNCKRKKVLDLGCGEGWLSRELRKQGLDVWGTDAVSALVQHAVENDGPFYFNHSYEDIIASNHQLPAPFDLVVINFALLDKEVTEKLITSLPLLLTQNGLVIIQTLHALAVASSGEYKSGWKEGSWDGMKREFVQPYQWYFRTLEDWFQLFANAGLAIKAIKEPVHPATARPLSYIFVLNANKT